VALTGTVAVCVGSNMDMTTALSIGANDAHQVTRCCTQKLCITVALTGTVAVCVGSNMDVTKLDNLLTAYRLLLERCALLTMNLII
jgi:hypothetical protein